jgi:hypothetical protein
MTSRNRKIFAAMYVMGLAGNAFANQSTPELKIRAYDFSGLSSETLHRAYLEAERMLRPAQIQVKWVECIPPVLSAECKSPQLPGDLTVRVVAKVLPPAGATALGLAAWSGDYAGAVIFFDRVMALQTSARPIGSMLGRVMAHEMGCRRSAHCKFSVPLAHGRCGAVHAERSASQSADRPEWFRSDEDQP